MFQDQTTYVLRILKEKPQPVSIDPEKVELSDEQAKNKPEAEKKKKKIVKVVEAESEKADWKSTMDYFTLMEVFENDKRLMKKTLKENPDIHARWLKGSSFNFRGERTRRKFRLYLEAAKQERVTKMVRQANISFNNTVYKEDLNKFSIENKQSKYQIKGYK